MQQGLRYTTSRTVVVICRFRWGCWEVRPRIFHAPRPAWALRPRGFRESLIKNPFEAEGFRLKLQLRVPRSLLLPTAMFGIDPGDDVSRRSLRHRIYPLVSDNYGVETHL
jgi:hypothetical protein